MSTDKGGASTPNRFVAAFSSPIMEMGSCFHVFITRLAMTWSQHDSIMVVVEKLTKETHFIPVKSTYKTDAIAKYSRRIFLDCMDCLRK